MTSEQRKILEKEKEEKEKALKQVKDKEKKYQKFFIPVLVIVVLIVCLGNFIAGLFLALIISVAYSMDITLPLNNLQKAINDIDFKLAGE